MELTRKERIKITAEKRIKLNLPKYTLGEEIFSAITHGASAIFAVVALILLLVNCEKTPLAVTSVCIFGVSMILLYTVSTLYHALAVNKAKKVFQTLDHCMIFILIAGTYTPITLIAIGGIKGIIMLSVVWSAGILGVVLNGISVKKFDKFSMVCYLAMGWVVIFAIKDVFLSQGTTVIALLGIGGIFYTVGAILYGIGKKKPYIHSIWHIFVFAGSLFHTMMVYNLVKA